MTNKFHDVYEEWLRQHADKIAHAHDLKQRSMAKTLQRKSESDGRDDD